MSKMSAKYFGEMEHSRLFCVSDGSLAIDFDGTLC